MLHPGTVFQLKVHPNAFVAEASPRTPQEELTTLHTPKLVSREPFRDRRRERTEAEGRKEGDGTGGKRKGAFSRILLFKFNHLEKSLE